MRRLIAIVLVSCLPAIAVAQTARVTSGDHDGFSRLVIELPGQTPWQFGRQSDGYAFVVSPATVEFDLAAVFDVIGRNRLASVSAKSVSGMLHIGLACACHAIPFEFRPGVIVIDFRDGPPPDGSSFELPLDATTGTTAPRRPKPRPLAVLAAAAQTPIAEMSQTVPAPRADDPVVDALTPQPHTGSTWVPSSLPVPPELTSTEPRNPSAAATGAETAYDWVTADPDVAPGNTEAAPGEPFVVGPQTPSLSALRDDLLMQLGRGAARGVIDLATSDARHASTAPGDNEQAALSQVMLNPFPGMHATAANDADPDLTGDGTRCIGDADLDLALWGRPGPVAVELSAVTSGLVGEFDTVNAETLVSATKYYLHLGFGAEATHLLDAFPQSEMAHETRIWHALGALVDGRTNPDGPFASMLPCDTAAAMWAVLATDTLRSSDKIGTDAVLRSFSALPLHLRLSLGPALADRFLAIGRDDVVRALRDSIRRAPALHGTEADLIDADMHLVKGAPSAAADLAQGVIDGAGPGVPKAMLALVTANLAQGIPIDTQTTDALSSLVREHQGSTLEQPLVRALILGLSSNGDATTAAAMLQDNPAAEAEFWTVLADLGSDSDLLELAVVAQVRPAPAAHAPARSEVSRRLSGMGFVDIAKEWLGMPTDDWEDDQLALAARLDLATGASAPVSLAQDDQVSGTPDAVLIRARDWPALAARGANPWKDAAMIVVASQEPPSELAPLAQATELLTAAAVAQQNLATLLAAVPSPPVPRLDSPESP